MISIKLTIRGIKKTQAALKKAKKDEDKAFKTAVRVEAYRLHNVLKDEIREGAPGGKRFEPLTLIARHMWGKKPGRSPLYRLAGGVRYWVASQEPFLVYVGFTGPKVSRSMKRLATILQTGEHFPVTEGRRRYLAARGDTIKRGRNKASARVFFLRESTTLVRFKRKNVMKNLPSVR